MRRRVAAFGRLARLYFWMEYLSFGPYLQKCRKARLQEMSGHRRALLYGDGDGRFLASLAQKEPSLAITAVDASRAMLQRAQRRLPAETRVRFVHADARDWTAEPSNRFDLLVSHFFLDCFDEEELSTILARVNAIATGDAIWVISEFAIPRSPVARLAGRLIVSGLYLAFGVLTGLSVRRLPHYHQVLGDAGWRLEDHRELLRGLLVSERWRRSMEIPTTEASG